MAFGISFHTLRLPSLYIYLHSLGGGGRRWKEVGVGFIHCARSHYTFIYLETFTLERYYDCSSVCHLAVS